MSAAPASCVVPDARPCRAGLEEAESGGGQRAAARSAAALIQYGSTRQRGAIQAAFCCVLAALGPAAADCLYISSVLPLKISKRRRQSESHIETALTTGGSHRADGPGYRVHGAHARGRRPARRLHQRCTRVHGRSAADAGNGATDGADQRELAPGDDRRCVHTPRRASPHVSGVPARLADQADASMSVAGVSRHLPVPAGLVRKSVSRRARWPAASGSWACASHRTRFYRPLQLSAVWSSSPGPMIYLEWREPGSSRTCPTRPGRPGSDPADARSVSARRAGARQREVGPRQ